MDKAEQKPAPGKGLDQHKVALLELRDLHVALEDGTEIVKGVDLAVSPGRSALMGPNGSSKSSLAYALMGHPAYEITGGEALFDGREIAELGADEGERSSACSSRSSIRTRSGCDGRGFMRTALNAIRKARAGGEDDPVPVPEFREEMLAAMEHLKNPA